ncbi:MAG: 6-phosphofructokinase [Thaumarchaeota archaeon]|nr:6-phosphofructokinase [Nitrososphaerota archaeon]
MKIAVLTGGGDAPGLNAVIRAVVKNAEENGHEIIGIRRGWAGLVNLDSLPLKYEDVWDIVGKGGTMLGSSRTNPVKMPDGVKKVSENLKKVAEGLIAIGGEDTLGVANALYKAGVKVVGVPKTIDNDLSNTDVTIGFDTAVNITVEAIDRIRTTGESHDRVMIVEVMGRHTGWIALHSGLAAGAELILLPEEKFDLDVVCKYIASWKSKGKRSGIVVVAEGAEMKESSYITTDAKTDSFGHVRLGGIGQFLADEIEKRVGMETRSVVLGHLARGGTPSAFDRYFGTRLGLEAVELVKQGKWGYMLSLQGTRLVSIPLESGVSKLKTVSPEMIETAKAFQK